MRLCLSLGEDLRQALLLSVPARVNRSLITARDRARFVVVRAPLVHSAVIWLRNPLLRQQSLTRVRGRLGIDSFYAHRVAVVPRSSCPSVELIFREDRVLVGVHDADAVLHQRFGL